jgi:hypothetical protein
MKIILILLTLLVYFFQLMQMLIIQLHVNLDIHKKQGLFQMKFPLVVRQS